MVWSAIPGSVVSRLFAAIDRAVADQGQAAAIKARLQEMVLAGQMREIEAAADIRAEAAGDSWLQRSWRPLAMLTFVALIVAKWLGVTAPGVTEAVELALLEIVKIGLGGYVIGRSVEKGIRVWKGR